MASLRASTLLRPLAPPRFSVRASSITSRQSRYYASQSYGSGEGDPKGEKPQEQGSNPVSAEKEHPGPPPPDVGKGSGGGPTKAGEEGHNTGQTSSSGGSSSNSSSGQSGASQSSGGPQPKILSEGVPAEESDDVKAHNEDMAKRHDRTNAEADNKEQRVGKGFWKGMGGADRDP